MNKPLADNLKRILQIEHDVDKRKYVSISSICVGDDIGYATYKHMHWNEPDHPFKRGPIVGMGPTTGWSVSRNLTYKQDNTINATELSDGIWFKKLENWMSKIGSVE